MDGCSRVRLERLIRELPLWKVGAMTGIEHTKLSRIERGIATPSEDEAEALARAFDREAADLFQEVDGELRPVPGEAQVA